MNQLVEKEAYNRTTNYEYDRRGNRILETSINTQENRRTYEWDETGHLVEGTRGPDYGLYTSTYTYNGLGKRVNSTIMGPDKTIYDRDYVIDYTSPEYNDLAEYNEGHYQWQGDKPVHELYHLYNASGERLQVTTNRFSQWGGDNILYKRNVHEDIMGSAVYYTQQDTGYIKNKHEYSTWGNNTKAPTYNYDPEYRSTEPYYTGHPYDGSLNIYYAEARFYDAETGSWLSKDPAGTNGGLNLYQYCKSNPTSYVDQTGEIATELILEVIAAIVGAAVGGCIYWNYLNHSIQSDDWRKPNVDILNPPKVKIPNLETPKAEPKNVIIPNPLFPQAPLRVDREVFPKLAQTVSVTMWTFPVFVKSYFQNIVCTKGGTETAAEDYYKKGRPEGGNPKEDTLVRKDTAKVKSEDFKEFLEDKGETPSTWKKVMETWETPEGDLYERHYWTNGTDSYYHD